MRRNGTTHSGKENSQLQSPGSKKHPSHPSSVSPNKVKRVDILGDSRNHENTDVWRDLEICMAEREVSHRDSC